LARYYAVVHLHTVHLHIFPDSTYSLLPVSRHFSQDSETLSSTDVLSLRMFCPTDVLSSRTFCPTDVLSPRTFCPHGRFVRRTFCLYGRFVPTDILSLDVLSPDVLSLQTFCLRTFCLGTVYKPQSPVFLTLPPCLTGSVDLPLASRHRGQWGATHTLELGLPVSTVSLLW
jgi:hypothetical protein